MGGERAQRGSDILLNIEISFMDAVHGTKKDLLYEKKGQCPTCKGTKCKPGTQATVCAGCGGKGLINYRQGSMTVQMQCSKCRGSGNIIKNPCTTCRGQGVSTVQHKEDLHIPKGISNGQNLRMTGKGNMGGDNAPSGDLIIRVTVKPDPYFKREGFDIYTDGYITISQAVLGGAVEVRTLYGTQSVKFPKGTQQGQKFKLSAMGVPRINSDRGEKGDHYVIFKIVVPKTLNQKQLEIFKQLAMLEEKPNVEQYAQQFKEEEPAQNSQQQYKKEESEFDERGGGRRKQQDEEPDMFDIFSQLFGATGGRRK